MWLTVSRPAAEPLLTSSFHLYTSLPPSLQQSWHMARCPKSGLQRSLKGPSLPTDSTCSYHSNKNCLLTLCCPRSLALSNSALYMTVYHTLLSSITHPPFLCLYFSRLPVCFPRYHTSLYMTMANFKCYS